MPVARCSLFGIGCLFFKIRKRIAVEQMFFSRLRLVVLFVALVTYSTPGFSMFSRGRPLFRCVTQDRYLLCVQTQIRSFSGRQYYPSRSELSDYMDGIVSSLQSLEAKGFSIEGDCQYRADSLGIRIRKDYADKSLRIQKHFIDWRPFGRSVGECLFNYHAFLVVRGTSGDDDGRWTPYALDPFCSRLTPIVPLSDFLEVFPPGGRVVRQLGWDILGQDLFKQSKQYRKCIHRNAELLNGFSEKLPTDFKD